MHAFANPARFLRFARPATIWLLLIGLALEGLSIRKAVIRAEIETAPRAFLGREQPAAFNTERPSSRDLSLKAKPETVPEVASYQPFFAIARKIIACFVGSV